MSIHIFLEVLQTSGESARVEGENDEEQSWERKRKERQERRQRELEEARERELQELERLEKETVMILLPQVHLKTRLLTRFMYVISV